TPTLTTHPHSLSLHDALPISFDPSYAPQGKHTAFWWPFAPYAVEGDKDNWEKDRKGYTEKILDYWGAYTTNLDADNILGSYLKRSEEHTSELQSRRDLVCRLL